MQDLASQLGVNAVYFKKMNVHAYNQKIALPEGFISDLKVKKKRTPPACLNGWFFMEVKLDGRLSTCCRIHQMPLGDFDKKSFKQIWLSGHRWICVFQGNMAVFKRCIRSVKPALFMTRIFSGRRI